MSAESEDEIIERLNGEDVSPDGYGDPMIHALDQMTELGRATDVKAEYLEAIVKVRTFRLYLVHMTRDLHGKPQGEG